ncbi:MAG: glutamate 5-kinase [Candidatus Omnitrophica bacterium]|nr:glutamate 5-kinase [Candidatus Omnitrophota bacterium]
MKQSERSYKRIVVKAGSSMLFGDTSCSDSFFFPMKELSRQISGLMCEKKEVVVVSSGAIASGMHLLKAKLRPKELSSLQATAALGQHFLMSQYQGFFEKRGLNCAQLLLTYDDFNDRRRYLNAKGTISNLLLNKIVPIVNENDTISTDEIKFGDNDKLSALVATLIDADLLIILSDVDGLWDSNKNIIRVVDEITPEIKSLACPTDKQRCVGGMITKIEAAKIATDSGIPCVIANGNKKDILLSVVADPKKQGTLFVSRKSLDAKQRWMAFGTKTKGKIMVDDGAKRALLSKKSLLSVGVCKIDGNFDSREVVSVTDKDGKEFARGKVSLSSKHLEKVKGARFEKEIIHRDNIVIL